MTGAAVLLLHLGGEAVLGCGGKASRVESLATARPAEACVRLPVASAGALAGAEGHAWVGEGYIGLAVHVES